MHIAKSNFAYVGRTYHVGDTIPDEIAKELPEHLLKAPDAKTATKKTDTLEGDK